MTVTDFANVPDAPVSEDPALLAALARDLTALGYTVDGVEALLGVEAYQAFTRDQAVPALLKTRDDDGGLAAVVRLWLLAEPVARGTLAAALPESGVAALLALRLVDADGPDALRAAVDLRPYGWPANDDGSGGAELWVASDLAAHQRPGVLRRDHVLGIGQASLTLAQSIVRTPVARALDVGTGCGIQTFHLLHHADQVAAIDISERALAFTRFNLLLNAVELLLDPSDLQARVRLFRGSLLEPVAGETFSLVVSNPPFVITPRHRGESARDRFTYRDGGLPGDEIVAELVRGLPAVLAPGGTAQLLGNWEIRDPGAGGDPDAAPDTGTDPDAEAGSGADMDPDARPDARPGTGSWYAGPESWVPEAADAWFIQREQVGPGQYAETWLQDASENRDRALYAESYAAYLDDFASRGVRGIGFGLIWLRNPLEKSAGPRIRRFEEILYPIEQPVGPHLGAAVGHADWLAGLAPGRLQDTRLTVAEDVTEERHQRPGAEHPGVILLRQGAGLRRTNLLSTELAGFVSVCDGELTVGQIIGALEALLGREEDGSASDSFTHGLLEEIRQLILDGFLLPITPS
ncbi:methyltransferase [Paenarthrobacter sp. PH39-S1]|uniref:DUF7059 domain-containing protein n=1 Tax=Paenarthrobacter sp. PH39-S1 TaxID=3046204 RepID=UPI0024BB792B|nr:methyltransferase [Paenarthrobacter sp. PH39-S1]MDJ0355153.1 methyltransferase [Paenarthrobacter sp. PH39-S1]